MTSFIPQQGVPTNIKWSTCKGCGKRILYAAAVLDSGEEKIIPLDPVPAIYHIAWNEDGSALARRASRNRLMVNHFSTCPKANDFSAGGKRT